VAAHAHWRRKLDEYNRNSVITVDGPTRPFNTESLLDGQPAALVALLGGKPHDAVRILAAQLSQWSDEGLSSRHALAPRTLLLQSHLAGYCRSISAMIARSSALNSAGRW
jgi:hypothetical protein